MEYMDHMLEQSPLVWFSSALKLTIIYLWNCTPLLNLLEPQFFHVFNEAVQ